MIVKNARSLLPGTLDALQPLWELDFLGQAVFVDTGSQDGTLDYLQKRFEGMPQVQISALDWPEDFSKARNAALERVNTPWVLFLDADEALSPASISLLVSWQHTLQQSPAAQWPEAVVCVRHNLDEQGRMTSQDYLTRLWQSSPAIRYVGRVHERPVYFLAPDQARPLEGVQHLAVHLKHRAASPETSAAKQKMYGRYLAQARSETPSPYLDYHWVISPQVQRTLSPAARLAILWPAIEATQSQAAQATSVLPFPAWAGVPWAAALLEAQYLWAESGQSEAMITFFTTYLAAEHPLPLFAESWGQLALAYVAGQAVQPQRWMQAIGMLYKALDPTGSVFELSQGWNTWQSHGLLAQLYLQLGDSPAAWCHCHLAWRDTDVSPEMRRTLRHLRQQLDRLCPFVQAVEQLQRAWARAIAAQDDVAMAWLSCFLWGLQGSLTPIEKLRAVNWGLIPDTHPVRVFKRYLTARHRH